MWTDTAEFRNSSCYGKGAAKLELRLNYLWSNYVRETFRENVTAASQVVLFKKAVEFQIFLPPPEFEKMY